MDISKGWKLLCGVLMASFILVQSVEIKPALTDQQEQSGEDTENTGEANVIQSDAIPNSAPQINLEFDSYLLEEVTFQEADEEKSIASELVFQSIRKATKVLFRKIISPNAP